MDALAGEVLLVPDCGPGRGLGHLERALALADHLHAAAPCRVVVAEGDDASAQRVAARGHHVLAGRGDVSRRAVEACRAVEPDVMVVDAYGVAAPVQATLRRDARLVVVDDLGGDCDCDLAVNPSPAGAEMAPGGADAFLGGAAYALLSPAYLQARRSRDEDGAGARSVLLSSGATALGGLGAQIAAEMLAGDAHLRVVAVAGPDMDAAALPRDPRLEVLVAPSSLAAALAGATVYVGAAGTTSVQAACVGVPAVVVPAVANQQAQAAALEAAGCAIRATVATAAARAVHLLDDGRLLTEMARRGRDLVDGRGAERVAAAIAALVANRARR